MASADLLTHLPLTQACALLEVPRGSFYRSQQRPVTGPPPDVRAERDTALRAAVETLILEHPDYGYPRVTVHLQRTGWAVNHKRVYRVMREAGLLQRRKRRTVRTTDSEHGWPCYPNLLADCGWRHLTAPNQAWGADFTYLRLRDQFAYLAVLLDAYSRKVIGWALGTHANTALCVAALRQALATRQPAAGFLHHSDQGVQYASTEYIALLQAHGAVISMSRTGRPTDNAQVESFFKTLKHGNRSRGWLR